MRKLFLFVVFGLFSSIACAAEPVVGTPRASDASMQELQSMVMTLKEKGLSDREIIGAMCADANLATDGSVVVKNTDKKRIILWAVITAIGVTSICLACYYWWLKPAAEKAQKDAAIAVAQAAVDAAQQRAKDLGDQCVAEERHFNDIIANGPANRDKGWAKIINTISKLAVDDDFISSTQQQQQQRMEQEKLAWAQDPDIKQALGQNGQDKHVDPKPLLQGLGLNQQQGNNNKLPDLQQLLGGLFQQPQQQFGQQQPPIDLQQLGNGFLGLFGNGLGGNQRNNKGNDQQNKQPAVQQNPQNQDVRYYQPTLVHLGQLRLQQAQARAEIAAAQHIVESLTKNKT